MRAVTFVGAPVLRGLVGCDHLRGLGLCYFSIPSVANASSIEWTRAANNGSGNTISRTGRPAAEGGRLGLIGIRLKLREKTGSKRDGAGYGMSEYKV